MTDAAVPDWGSRVQAATQAVTGVSGHRERAAPRLLLAGVLLVAAAVALCACALSSVLLSRGIGYGSVALACYAAGLLCLAGAREGDLGLARWKLGSWILVWYGLASGLATLIWTGPQHGIAGQVFPSSVLRALWLVAVAMTCWALGYAAGPGVPLRQAADRAVRALSARRSGSVLPLAPWAMYAVATAARIASAVTTGRVGYVGDAASAVSTASGYGQALSALALLGPLAVCAAALQAYRERRPGARVTMAVLFAGEMAFGVVAGNKDGFVVAVLAVVIPASAERRRVPKPAVLAAVAVFLLVVVPYTLAYRDAARAGSVTLTASQAAREAPGILRQSVTGGGVVTSVPGSLAYLLQRISQIAAPAVIMQRTPSQILYASPAQLAVTPLGAFIPRAVWPGKPILDDGYQFSQQYYGLPAGVYTSSAITPAGDLYRHGGWLPVIGGMFLLGCAVRLLDGTLDVRANPHAVFLVLLLFPALVKGEDDWVTLLAAIPAVLAVWVLAVSLAFRRAPALSDVREMVPRDALRPVPGMPG